MFLKLFPGGKFEKRLFFSVFSISNFTFWNFFCREKILSPKYISFQKLFEKYFGERNLLQISGKVPKCKI